MKINKNTICFHMVCVAMFIGATACSDKKWETMNDDVLASKSRECLSIGDPGPAMIQVCQNVTRECERRRANGIFAC